MNRRLTTWTAAIALAMSGAAGAQEQATVLKRDGTRVSGRFEAWNRNTNTFYIRVSLGDQRIIPLGDAAVIDVEGNGQNLPETELGPARGGDHVLVLRNGEVIRGRLLNIEGGEGSGKDDEPRIVSFKPNDGAERRARFTEVRRLYLGNFPSSLGAQVQPPVTQLPETPMPTGAIRVGGTAGWVGTTIIVRPQRPSAVHGRGAGAALDRSGGPRESGRIAQGPLRRERAGADAAGWGAARSHRQRPGVRDRRSDAGAARAGRWAVVPRGERRPDERQPGRLRRDGAPHSPPVTGVVVVAAVIERDGRFLLTLRPAGTHLADHWEFPGGKCEPHETHAEALRRELHEELGIVAEVGALEHAVSHTYPERTVELHFYRCTFVGEPTGLIGQEVRWVARAELATLPFPDADLDLIARLAAEPRP